MSSLTSCFVGGDQATTPSTLLRSGGRLDLARQTAAANALVRDFIGSERATMAADMCADPALLARPRPLAPRLTPQRHNSLVRRAPLPQPPCDAAPSCTRGIYGRWQMVDRW
jgi:hypothetical protein